MKMIDHAEETYPHFESPRGQRDIAQAKKAVAVIREMLTQLRRGVHKNRARRNPLLGIFGGNPKTRIVRELGRVMQVRYKRKDNGKLYYHDYTSKPRLLALSDGSIWITS